MTKPHDPADELLSKFCPTCKVNPIPVWWKRCDPCRNGYREVQQLSKQLSRRRRRELFPSQGPRLPMT